MFKAWEVDFIVNGHENLEVIVHGTYERAIKVAKNLAEKTGKVYIVKEDSFPDYLR